MTESRGRPSHTIWGYFSKSDSTDTKGKDVIRAKCNKCGKLVTKNIKTMINHVVGCIKWDIQTRDFWKNESNNTNQNNNDNNKNNDNKLDANVTTINDNNNEKNFTKKRKLNSSMHGVFLFFREIALYLFF